MKRQWKVTEEGIVAVKEKRGPVVRKVEAESGYSARRERFIMLYSDPSSQTYLNGTQSALKAGYAECSAAHSACQILKQLRAGKHTRLLDLLQRFGLSKELWAITLVRAVHDKKENGAPTKEALAALRMSANVFGESVADAVAVQNVTVNQQINIPQMVVVGANDERLKLLEAGASEQTEAEELHQETVIEAG